MCIIIAKPISVCLPPINHIKESFKSNPDGFACMWTNKKGKIQDYKTMNILDCLSFYRQLLQDENKWKETPMTFHFRLATHGSRGIQNCHAFMDDHKTVGFQHNGILNFNVPESMDITDSEYFFKFLFIPLYKLNKNEMNFDHVIQNLKGSFDKFVFLQKDKLYLFGMFHEDGGCFYSNRTYKQIMYSTPYRFISNR